MLLRFDSFIIGSQVNRGGYGTVLQVEEMLYSVAFTTEP
jgi:hypothetical protein